MLFSKNTKPIARTIIKTRKGGNVKLSSFSFYALPSSEGIRDTAIHTAGAYPTEEQGSPARPMAAGSLLLCRRQRDRTRKVQAPNAPSASQDILPCVLF